MNEILIRKAKKGDKDAFCRLIDENVQSMYKVAAAYLKNDEDVADAIQDTILSCYENLKSLKQNRYFKTWMLRILINKCKNIIRGILHVIHSMLGHDSVFIATTYNHVLFGTLGTDILCENFFHDHPTHNHQTGQKNVLRK